MTITWHGYSCVKLQEPAKEGEVTVVVDPFVPAAGEKLPRNLAADLVVLTAPGARHGNKAAVNGEYFLIDGPGEYEVKDVFVTGVSTMVTSEKDKPIEGSVAILTVGDVRLVHLGAVREALPETVIEAIGSVDVLCVPCGGGDTLSPAVAADMVRKLDPRVIIPIHYRADGSGADLEPIDAFLKAMGMAKVEAVPKLKILKRDLPQEEIRLVILDPQ